MFRMLPTMKGWTAILLAVLSCMLYPFLLPTFYESAGGSKWISEPVTPLAWIIGGIALIVCFAASIAAFRRGLRPDKVAAGIAVLFGLGLLTEYLQPLTLRVRPPLADLDKVEGLNGMTEAQIIAQLGAPLRRMEFPMSKALDEFHVALQNYHPSPQSKDVIIHELTWEQPQVFVTAWLHETNGTWRVFDNLKYRKDVVF